MTLLYVSSNYVFVKRKDDTFGLPFCADSFFEKYLVVFDKVRVLGEHPRKYIDESRLVKISNPNISVSLLKSNSRPKEMLNDIQIKKELTKEIKKADAVLIKPACRKGIMAIKIAKKLDKPYMIEMTGDICNALSQSDSLVKRLYSPYFYKEICRAIRSCKYGLYVSQSYLQRRYPISGYMCGCSDVKIKSENISDSVLHMRFSKIDSMSTVDRINLGLIGFYQGKLKGVDTAIRALSHLPQNYHLCILGNGTAENRKYWYEYGERIGVNNRIHFPDPLSCTDEVLKWIDNIDILVQPTLSEGLSRCTVEALSRACPCITTDVCTMPELIGSSFLHKVGDDLALSKIVMSMTTNKSVMKKAAAENFERSKQYAEDILSARRNSFLRDFRKYAENYKAYTECKKCGSED